MKCPQLLDSEDRDREEMMEKLGKKMKKGKKGQQGKQSTVFFFFAGVNVREREL